MGRLFLAVLTAVAGLALAAVAQEELRTPVVESTGKATVYAPPASAGFWLHRTVQGESLEASMARALALEEDLRTQLGERELSPTLAEVMPPAVLHLTDNVVSASAHLQFSMTPFGNARTGPPAFAKLCAAVAALGEQLQCEVQGPLLKAGDEGALVKAAAVKATENAYLPASGVAEALKSSIYAVDTVIVDEVQWNAPLDSEAVEPNLRQVSCTVTVRVAYTLGGRD